LSFFAVMVLVALTTAALAAAPSGTGFTYQGQLKDAGVPFEGPVNLVFKLFNSAVAGKLLGTQAVNGVPVTNGLFTVELNTEGQFGANAFTGDARWLDISVNGTALAPRQALTPTPYALHALNAPASPSNWLDNGKNVYLPTGNVGVGTDTPTEMLHLQRPYATTAVRFQSVRFDQGAPVSSLRAPGSAATSGVGTTWNTPGAALASDDAWAASNLSAIVGEPDADQSRFLDLSALGFALPAGAEVAGIIVQTEGHATAGCSDCEVGVVNLSMELLGGPAESVRQSVSLTPSDASHVRGGTFDSWGLEWTPEAINAAGFGVRLSANLVVGNEICIFGVCGILPCDCTGTGTSFVDAVTIRVNYYDAPTTSTPFDWSIGIPETSSGLHVSPTANLGSPAIFVDTAGHVGINTTAPGPFHLAVAGLAAKSTGSTWAALSDRRLKRNIEPLTGALGRLLSLQGATFEFTEEGLRTGLALPGRQVGLIAQDVELVFPEWVGESSEGYKFITETGTTALLVEALRELRAEKNAELLQKDAEIDELRRRLTKLEINLEKFTNHQREENK